MSKEDQAAEASTKTKPVTFRDLCYRQHFFECCGENIEVHDSHVTVDNPKVIQALDDHLYFERV